MPNASNAQYDFRGGEWSPFAQGRMDDPRYKTAMKVCFNSFPLEEGTWTRRSGTRHSLATRNGAAGKMLKFTFNQLQPYNIELTAGHMRFRTGKTLALSDSTPVVSISTATPAVMTVNPVTWATDDQVVFQYADATTKEVLAHLCNRTLALAKLTSATFALYDAVTGMPIDGTQVGWSSGLAATVGRVQDLVTPWATTAVAQSCRVVQAERTGVILQGATKPQVVYAASLPTDAADAQFTITPASFLDGPYLDPFPGSTISPSATQGLINLTLGFQAYVAAKAYKVGDYVSSAGIGYRSLVDANVGNTPASSPTYWIIASAGDPIGPSGFVNSDIGRAVRLYNSTPAAAYVAGTTYNQGEMVSNNSIGYVSLVSGNIGNTPATSPAFWAVQSPGWTWGRISAMSTTGLIDPLSGTSIGTLLESGGLAAAFDGTINKNYANAATHATLLSQTADIRDYAGKQYAAGVSVATAIVTPPLDTGFAVGVLGSDPTAAVGVAGDVIISLYGKNSAPANSTDGVLLGFATLAPSDVKKTVTITSSDAVTTYTNIWVTIKATVYYAGSPYGFAKLGIAQAQFYNSTGAPGRIAQIQVLGNPLPNTNTITTWQLGAWSDTTGWPTTGCYHEGRFWFGGAIDNRFDASCSNDPFNMAPTNVAGVVGDGNAISRTFNSAKTNKIMWMKPDLQGIACGTQEGEYLLQASAANQVMTNANIQGHLVTHYGCANVEPAQTGLTTMFVQAHGRRVHEYLSDIFSGRFFAPNATERAKHITKSGIVELAYQEELTPIVWARKGDGTFAGATYRRTALSSSAEPLFNGWHRHELGSKRSVESLVSSPSSDGSLDSITMITNDAETGIRHVEVLQKTFDEEDEITSAWFVDNGIVPCAIKTVTVDGNTRLRLLGLWPLNGKTVSAWLGGVDCGDFIVANGYIDVPYSGLLTAKLLTDLSTSGIDFGDMATSIDRGMLTVPAVVGFTYTSQGQIVRPNDPVAVGARQGPGFGKDRRIHKFAALFHNAQGVKVGTTFSALDPVLFKRPGATERLPANVLFSGMHKGTITDKGGDMDGCVAWEVSRPYPASIAAIGEFLSTQDE